MTDVLYPVWRYHATRPACIVKTAEEDAELGKGWVDSPNKLTKDEDKKLAPHPDNELPGGGRIERPDQGLPGQPGRPARPDNELPGGDREPGRPDNDLPSGRPGGRPDNELPETPEPKRKK